MRTDTVTPGLYVCWRTRGVYISARYDNERIVHVLDGELIIVVSHRDEQSLFDDNHLYDGNRFFGTVCKEGYFEFVWNDASFLDCFNRVEL